ncbi:hypothetical protein [Streptomyces flavofungini]|uniref:hypothetical protein n=1 Tax=Streptomyces flavofungini TaxID=68200 RepID=UPI0025AFD5F5|nr:hypothetical protein [Streptomyces flavofungini]WJV44542.1 hypothetical protein QUY26_02745 [Streptomyces flavofungini]
MATKKNQVRKDIEVPDHEAIRDTAQRHIEKEFSRITRPDDRLKRAAEVVQQADLEIVAHVGERNEAAMSLWFYEGVRGLDKVLGVTGNAYTEMRRLALHGADAAEPVDGTEKAPEEWAPLTKVRRRAQLSGPGETRMTPEQRRHAAEQAGIPKIDGAAEVLPRLSEIVSAATARRKAALPFLQDAVLVLSEAPYEWTTDRIAEFGDVTARYARDAKNTAKRRRGH